MADDQDGGIEGGVSHVKSRKEATAINVCATQWGPSRLMTATRPRPKSRLTGSQIEPAAEDSRKSAVPPSATIQTTVTSDGRQHIGQGENAHQLNAAQNCHRFRTGSPPFGAFRGARAGRADHLRCPGPRPPGLHAFAAKLNMDAACWIRRALRVAPHRPRLSQEREFPSIVRSPSVFRRTNQQKTLGFFSPPPPASPGLTDVERPTILSALAWSYDFS